MDPRDRADALLARARARGAHVVTPDNMTSPMDSSATQQIPRAVVNAVDPRELDPESTMVISAQMASGGRPQQAQQQQYQQQQPQQHQQAPHQQQHYQQHQQPTQPEPVQRVGPGPVPTVQQAPSGRPSLTQRLSGDQPPPPGLAQRLSGDA
ncbi:hypothetical protein ACFFQW_45295 [Umezawaea endophytica]|uniref:Uncharacterized protein n=1 Tax=Umezawaea endophytica TaxID=1654476 RepID=A0A9X2VSU9_9PSEU|nr:hypothetical protein [Umezawaea endophytica]MCS7481707.1 hypothetical protein [Umezawaea endophytica]